MLLNTGSFYSGRGEPSLFPVSVLKKTLRSLGSGDAAAAVMVCEVALPTHLSPAARKPGPQAWHWKEPRVLTQTPLGQELGSLHSSMSTQGEGGTLK